MRNWLPMWNALLRTTMCVGLGKLARDAGEEDAAGESGRKPLSPPRVAYS
jgi:hypothetical protein